MSRHGNSLVVTEHDRQDRVWFLRLDHQRHCHLEYSLWRKLEFMSWGLSNSPLRATKSSANVQSFGSHLHRPPWKQISQTQSCLQMTAALANILSAILWETLTQEPCSQAASDLPLRRHYDITQCVWWLCTITFGVILKCVYCWQSKPVIMLGLMG